MTTIVTEKEILDALEEMWWQFGYLCGPEIKIKSSVDGEILMTYYPYRHSGGLSALEEAEWILLKHGRIEKYRKNGKMEWYKLAKKEEPE